MFCKTNNKKVVASIKLTSSIPKDLTSHEKKLIQDASFENYILRNGCSKLLIKGRLMLKIDIPDAVDRNKESTLLFRAITYPHHICEMRFANEKQTIHNRRKTPPFIWKNFVVMIPPGKQKFIEIEISSHGDTALLAVQDVLFYQ